MKLIRTIAAWTVASGCSLAAAQTETAVFQFGARTYSAAILDDPEKRAWVMSRVPIGRLGQREDIFGPVLFLASDVSSFVNGHVLMLDGGWLIA